MAIDYLKINPVALENATSDLQSYVTQLKDEVNTLNGIAKLVPQYWNEGLTADVQGYLQTLQTNASNLGEYIIPTIEAYISTMNSLADEVRTSASKSIEANSIGRELY